MHELDSHWSLKQRSSGDSSPGQVFSRETGLFAVRPVSLAPQGAEVWVLVQAGLSGRWPAHLPLVVRVDAVPWRNVPLQGSRRGVKLCPFQAWCSLFMSSVITARWDSLTLDILVLFICYYCTALWNAWFWFVSRDTPRSFIRKRSI